MLCDVEMRKLRRKLDKKGRKAKDGREKREEKKKEEEGKVTGGKRGKG